MFDEKKLILCFEYATVLNHVAQEHKVEMNADLVKRAEEMILNEFKNKTPEELAVDMHANILSLFNTDPLGGGKE